MGRRDRGFWFGFCVFEFFLRREAFVVIYRFRYGMNRGGMWIAEGDSGSCGVRG